MLPRWRRVFCHISRVSGLGSRTEFALRDKAVSSLRKYATVAADVEPNGNSENDKPEVNLNKMFWSKPCSVALPADSPKRIEDPHYEGVKLLMMKLLLFYSKQSQFIRWSNVIYLRIKFQVDKPAIYDVFSLEKTFKTAFSLLVLHMWLCLRRLKEEGKDGVELGQYLFEIYNHDLELRVSKAGVNLLLSKWMKELERMFYGNIIAYDAALGKQHDLQNAIWRNVFSDGGDSKPSEDALLPVQAFTRYVRREASCLSLTDKEAIFSGNFMFTPLEGSCLEGTKKVSTT